MSVSSKAQQSFIPAPTKQTPEPWRKGFVRLLDLYAQCIAKKQPESDLIAALATAKALPDFRPAYEKFVALHAQFTLDDRGGLATKRVTPTTDRPQPLTSQQAMLNGVVIDIPAYKDLPERVRVAAEKERVKYCTGKPDLTSENPLEHPMTVDDVRMRMEAILQFGGDEYGERCEIAARTIAALGSLPDPKMGVMHLPLMHGTWDADVLTWCEQRHCLESTGKLVDILTTYNGGREHESEGPQR